MPKLVLDKPKGLRLVLDEPTAFQNDPNDVTIRARESLDVADNLELPLIQAEEIADARDGEKLERPGLFKRGVFGLVNKALVQPVKNIFKYGGIGEFDTLLESYGEVRRVKEKTGKEVSNEELVKILERSQAKVHKRIQSGLPGLQIPAAEGVVEKGVELATGLGAFVARLVLARKFVGGKGVGAEIAAFEVVNQVDNGPPGLGVLLAGSLGLIGRVPAATLGGKGLKLAGQGGALASVTAIRGGEPEDIAVAFFLPTILQTFNQFPGLIKGKAWDIKTAKGAKELGIFKGVPLKNIKQWSAAMRDAAKVKAGTMTPKRWGAKHGKNLEDFSNKVGKSYDDVAKLTGELAKPAVAKPPSKAVKKPPSKPVKAKPAPKAKITPVTPEVAAEADVVAITMKRGSNASVTPEGIRQGGELDFYEWVKDNQPLRKALNKWMTENKIHSTRVPAEDLRKFLASKGYKGFIQESFAKYIEDLAQPPTKAEGKLLKDKIYETSEIPRELFKGHITINDNNRAGQPTVRQLSNGQVVVTTDPYQSKWKLATEADLNVWGPDRAWVKKGIAAIKAQSPTKAEGVIKLFKEHTTKQGGLERGMDFYRDKLEELSDEDLGKVLDWSRQPERTGYIGRFVKDEVAAVMRGRGLKPERTIADAIEAEQVAKMPLFKPKLKPIKEEVDILGGIDPINQIHTALKAAKAVRPITEAAKKEALRKRVGAAAGALRAGLKKGMPAEQAILKSTGLLKGPLTEYDQRYESIEDTLEPGAKDAAYGMIARHPDLKYFEVVNTQKSFQKLLAGSDLTPKDAENIERVFGKVFDEIVKPRTKKSDLYERLIATWKAGLLTGMKTSGLNILSTASHAVSETAKDVPASLVDSGIALVTGERTVAFTTKGYGFGFKEGLGKGWRYMKTGYDERNVLEKYDYKKTNFGTSKKARAQQAYVEFVFHLLGAEDQPFYYGALSRSLYSQAIAQAKNKGLKGKAKDAYVTALIEKPKIKSIEQLKKEEIITKKTPKKDYVKEQQKELEKRQDDFDRMLELAKEDAEGAIYTNRTHLGDVAKSIQKVKGGEVVVPFGRTPSAVAMQIINYSPIGVVKEISEQIHKGKFNQRKFSHAAGRTVIGTGALYLGVQLFKAGLIALGYPDNERERKLWELEGRKPNSIKVGDEWRDIQAFGPVGNLLVIGGYFQQALDSKGSPTEAMVEAMTGGAKSFTEQTFVRGVNLAVDALTDPEASFDRWFTSMSGSLVPTIVADIARAQDDRERLAVGPKERIQSRIPIYRKGLPPKINVFGQDIPRYGGNVLESMADPTRPSKIRQDIVVDELRRLWDKDIKVSPTLLGDKAGYDILTKEENTQLWQRAGELTYKGLFAAINSEGYKEANDFGKGRLLDLVVRNAKTAAKLEIVVIKKEQGKTIMQLAESGLFTVEEFEMLKYFQSNPIE